MSKIRMQELWPTPIWEIDLPTTPQFNQELLAAFGRVRPTKVGIYFNLFDHKSEPSLVTLEKLALNAVAEAFEQAGVRRQVLGIRTSSVNAMQPGGWDTPHTHPSSMLVGVYYVKVPDGSGDLWLLNAGAAGSLWDARVGKAIKPVESKLVLFPGGVQHFVTPNNGSDVRVSVAMNFDCVLAGVPR